MKRDIWLPNYFISGFSLETLLIRVRVPCLINVFLKKFIRESEGTNDFSSLQNELSPNTDQRHYPLTLSMPPQIRRETLEINEAYVFFGKMDFSCTWISSCENNPLLKQYKSFIWLKIKIYMLLCWISSKFECYCCIW